MGYYLLDVPITHADFGKLQTCECLASRNNVRRRQKLHELSNLGDPAFKHKTFDTFDPYVPGVQEAYSSAFAFANSLALDDSQRPNHWLVLFGNYGCGKTHLAAAIGHAALHQNAQRGVVFLVVPDLLDHLRSAFAPQSEVAYDKMFEDIRNVSLLILDDLGTENATPWAREKLYQLINHRYNYRLATVITSNRDIKDIDPRIHSRMSDRELHEGIILITAGDYRRTRKRHPSGK